MSTGDTMELSIGLLAVSVAVAAAVLFVALPRVATPGAMTLFLRFAAVSGVCAVGSSAMYLIYGTGGGVIALVAGDVAMVLAPALLLVAVRVLDGSRALRTSLAALVLTLLVATVTATVPLPTSLAVKALALTVVSGACAWAAIRARVEPSGPLRIIAVVTAVYALYSLARVVVGFGAGWDSPLYLTAFSFAPATVLGALAVLLNGASVVRLRFGPRVAEPPTRCAPGAAVVLGDWDLASAAYGPDRMRALLVDLRAAARDLDPEAADVAGGVETSVPNATTALGERLRTAYDWNPEEVILLVDGAATAAIRTHPGRTRGRGSSRS